MPRRRKFSLGPRDKQIIDIFNVYLKDLKKKFPSIQAKKVLLLLKQDKLFPVCFGYYEPDTRLVRIATRAKNGSWYNKFVGLDTLCHECAHSAIVGPEHDHDEDFWALHYKIANYCFGTLHKRRKELWTF